MENEINGKYVVITSKLNCQSFPLNDKAIFVSYEDLEAIEKGTKCFDLETMSVVDYDNTIDKIVEQKNDLRTRRKLICFPIINRGELWYNNLTKVQKEELSTWYIEWLDVTETMEEPEVPEFLYEELEKFYLVKEEPVIKSIPETDTEETTEEQINDETSEEIIIEEPINEENTEQEVI